MIREHQPGKNFREIQNTKKLVFSDISSWDELNEKIARLGTTKITSESGKEYIPAELQHDINSFRSGKRSIKYITRAEGLRDTVRTLLLKNIIDESTDIPDLKKRLIQSNLDKIKTTTDAYIAIKTVIQHIDAIREESKNIEVLDILPDIKIFLVDMKDVTAEYPTVIPAEAIRGYESKTLQSSTIETETKSGVIVGVSTQENPYKNRENQDRVYVNEEHDLFVVVDGMGGGNNGGDAADNVVDAIKQHPNNIFVACEKAHANMQQFETNEGAVMCAARYRKPGTLEVYSVGDARCIVFGKLDDTTNMRSIKHTTTPDNEAYKLAKQGLITQAEVRNHPNRNIVHSYIGRDATTAPIPEYVRVNSKDLVLLITDGIEDNFTPEELAKIIQDETDPKKIMEHIDTAFAQKITAGERVKMDDKAIAIAIIP